MPPVAQAPRRQFRPSRAVDQDAADRRFACEARALAVDAQHVAVLDEQNLRLGSRPANTRRAIARMPGELPVFAVNRDEVARPHQRQHQFQLFLAAVPRDVHVLHRLRE